MTGMPSTSPLALNPGIVEPRRPRKRPQPMPISQGTAWNDLRALRDRSPVTCETSWKPPGRHLDSSTDESTGRKSKTKLGYSDMCPSFPSSLPADLARMTVVWLEATSASLALAPINPINPSGRSAPA
jgi:hypothetical protein